MHRLIVENGKGSHTKSICLFLFPIEQKSVVVGVFTIDSILRQRTLPPSIDATNAMNIQVDIEIDKATSLDLMRMLSRFQIFLTVVPGTNT